MINTDLQFKHLLQLLDDENPEIQRILRFKLLENSLEIILSGLQQVIEKDSKVSFDFKKIFHNLHNDLVFGAFSRLINTNLEDIDLEKATLILAYWNTPGLNIPGIIAKLDQMAEKIRINLPGEKSPEMVIHTMNSYLFEKLKFRGNSRDYYHPDNSFIDRMFISRKGIPISLSVLYILLAKRLNFPVFGVSMPAHFIVKYDDSEIEIFFDPYFKGNIYSRNECINFLKQINISDPQVILGGCPNYLIILRMMRNLHLIFSSYKNDPDKVSQLERYINLIENHFSSNI